MFQKPCSKYFSMKISLQRYEVLVSIKLVKKTFYFLAKLFNKKGYDIIKFNNFLLIFISLYQYQVKGPGITSNCRFRGKLVK